MEIININIDTVGAIFNYLRRGIIDLKGKCYSTDQITIFMPYYIKEALIVWQKQNQTIDTVDKQVFIFYGIEIKNGYEQDRIIISNSNAELFPDEVFYHTITFKDDQVLYDAGLVTQ